MIILFEENETQFISLGIGTLPEAKECKCTERIKDSFELTLVYPTDGKNFKEIKMGRFIYCKPNPFDEAQPFRIYSISRPINGYVTVDARHISYDMTSIPVNPLDAKNIQDVVDQLNNNKFDEDGKRKNYTIVPSKFVFSSDVTNNRTFRTTKPFNMRAILMGGDDSIIEKYEAEPKFDKYNVRILARRGENRGAKVVYGHNMTDIKYVSTNETLYNGVFPYYHTESTKTETTSDDTFKQVYVVGSKPFQDGWLSYSKDGQPYHPIDDAPVQVKTEGEYYDKVYTWNALYEKYEERTYNAQVMLISGVTEPEWISIDAREFPLVKCKAAKAGYFKKMTDTEWGDFKKVGDVIFEGNILTSGLNGIVENMIIYYAEVIPTSGNKENVEVTEVVDVQISDDPDKKIIWLDTLDARELLHDRVLMLDLSSEFDSEPTPELLKAKAEEYITKNKIGNIKHTTTVSFVDLSKTTEGKDYEHFDHIELGDDVAVVYKKSGINIELRVVSTEYNVLTDKYENIELGEVEKKFSSETIGTGDNISSLTNDIGYTTVAKVKTIIAETITAEFIEAMNAKLSNAQITQLQAERITCLGILEATQFELDKLVAKLLIADDAEIKNTLTAGNIKVIGDVSIKQGEINIHDENGTKYFNVDREGNLQANSVKVTGGELNINDIFVVQQDGTMFASNAHIDGTIYATAGEIGGCEIVDGVLKINEANIEGGISASIIDIKDAYGEDSLFEANKQPGVVKIAGFTVQSEELKAGTLTNFYDSDQTHTGIIVSTDGIFLKGPKPDPIPNQPERPAPYFKVGTDGIMYAVGAQITGEINATKGVIAGFNIGTESGVSYMKYGEKGANNSVYLGTDGIFLGANFNVDKTGRVTATNFNMEGGKISVGSINSSFLVNADGSMTASKANINGAINATSGSFASLNNYRFVNPINLHQLTNYYAFHVTGNMTIPDTDVHPWTAVPGDYSVNHIHLLAGGGQHDDYVDIEYDVNGLYNSSLSQSDADYLASHSKVRCHIKINTSTGEIVPNETYWYIYLEDVEVYHAPGWSSYDGTYHQPAVNQYQVYSIFVNMPLTQKYFYGGMNIDTCVLFVNDNSNNRIFQINWYEDINDPYIRIGTSNNNTKITKSDVVIQNVSVKNKLTELEQRANKIWGGQAQWNANDDECTLVYDNIPYGGDASNSNVAAINVSGQLDNSNNVDNPIIIRSYNLQASTNYPGKKKLTVNVHCNDGDFAKNGGGIVHLIVIFC